MFLDIDDELKRSYELSTTQYFKQKCTSQKRNIYNIYIYIYIYETIRYHFSGENLSKKLWLDRDAITTWEIGMNKIEFFM